MNNLENYIQEHEKEKCQKIVEAFAEYFEERTNATVVEAGKFGFVLLSDFYRGEFHDTVVCNNSVALFDTLWQSWLDWHLIRDFGDTSLSLSPDIYEKLTEEEKKPYDEKKAFFYNKCFGISSDDMKRVEDELPDIMETFNKDGHRIHQSAIVHVKNEQGYMHARYYVIDKEQYWNDGNELHPLSKKDKWAWIDNKPLYTSCYTINEDKTLSRITPD